MLIVCSGPDSFRAKQKIRGYVASFKEKYDKTGKSVEFLDGATAYGEVVARLSSPSLFNPKGMLVCSGLLDGLKVAQIKALSKALAADGDSNVVLDYEDKKPTQKTLEYFADKTVLLYPHDELEGQALRKEVQGMCQKYGVDQKQADNLIGAYGNDLWSIESALQIASVGMDIGNLDQNEQTNLFQLAESIMTSDGSWLNRASNTDQDDLLNVLISQFRSWHQVQAGCVDGVHPYVQKKMANLRVNDPNLKTLAAFRALYAARNSLSQGRESETMIF